MSVYSLLYIYPVRLTTDVKLTPTIKRLLSEVAAVRRGTIVALAAACVMALGGTMFASANTNGTGSVVVTLEMEALAITIVDGEVDFGGPFGNDEHLAAHPEPGAVADHAVAPPSILNSGNLEITSVVVSYDGPLGQEALCDESNGSWAARTTGVGTDEFTMRAWASNNTNWSVFMGTTNGGKDIHPSNGTGNALNGTLPAEDEVLLLLRLRTPDPATVGGGGCTIGLTVTATG